MYYQEEVKLLNKLKKEEVEELILKKEQGDMKARNKLIEHNIRLVIHLAKKYKNTNIDIEELVSIGTIGLVKGIDSYKLSKNTLIATYIAKCINNEILMCIRKLKKQREETSFDNVIKYNKYDEEVTLETLLSSNEDITESLIIKCENEELYKSLKKLDKIDQKILILRFGLLNKKALSQIETAKLVGLSQPHLCRREKKAIEKIKRLVKTKI